MRYRVSALAITRPDDGGVSINAMPPRRREAAKTHCPAERLAVDIPLVSDLDVLINQVQSSTART